MRLSGDRSYGRHHIRQSLKVGLRLRTAAIVQDRIRIQVSFDAGFSARDIRHDVVSGVGDAFECARAHSERGLSETLERPSRCPVGAGESLTLTGLEIGEFG